MFEGMVFTKNESEVKRELLSFPIAILIQGTILTVFILWSVFSTVEIGSPLSVILYPS